jgi:hypothetical protein
MYFPQIDGAGQFGCQLKTKGWPPSSNLLARPGDVFTINGAAADDLLSVIVVNNVRSDASGKAIVKLRRSLVSTGKYRNCSELPANNALLKRLGRKDEWTRDQRTIKQK